MSTSNTSKLVDSLAEKAIQTLIETGQKECLIEGAGGLVVIKNEFLKSGLMPLKNITKGEQVFTICLDRR